MPDARKTLGRLDDDTVLVQVRDDTFILSQRNDMDDAHGPDVVYLTGAQLDRIMVLAGRV